MFKLLFMSMLLCINLFSSDLQLSDAQKTYLSEQQTLKVHNEMNWPPFNFNEDGNARGYSIDYMNLVSKKLGLKVEYIHGFTWNEFVTKLKKHDIDIMLNMVKTKSREDFVEFTHPYLNVLSVIYTRPEDSVKINSLKDLQGKTVAIPKGFYVEELFKKHYPNVKLLLKKDNLEGLESVAIGEADATVGELGVLGYLAKRNFIGNIKVATKIKDERFLSIMHIGVRDDKASLRDLIQKAMDSIDDDEIEELEQKWFGYTQKSKAQLTKIEKQYIRDNQTITVHNEMNWPPFNFNEDGDAKGYSIDYMNLLANKVGLKIKYISGYTWNEFMTKIKNHDLDVMLNIVKTQKREKFINFTESYLNVMSAIYTTKQNVSKINTVEDLNGKTLAIPKGFYHQELFEKYYPNVKLLLTKNHLESLENLAIGKADATVGVMSVLDYLINKNFISNVKIAAKIDKKEFYSIMHIGVRDDKTMLNTIIQKGMDEITNEEVIELEQKWFGFTQKIDAKLTKKEKEFIRKNPIIKVHNELNWPPFNYNEDGVPMGYSIEYMNLVTKSVGLKVDYISGPSWDEFMGMIKNKELDVMLNIVKTSSRKKYINFTDPYLFATAVIYTNENKNINVKNITDLSGKIVAIPRGFFYQELFEKYFPNVLLLLTRNYTEALESVAAGKADATIGELGVLDFLIKQYFIPNVKIAASIKDKRFLSIMHIGVRDDKPILKDILQKGMNSISEAQIIELREKWVEEDAIENAVFRFTKDEKRYLKKKENITMCVSPNRKPFESINSLNYSGAVADVIEVMRKKLGYDFKVIPTKSWKESLAFIKAKKCELLPFVMKTQTKEEYLSFTTPYINSSLAIATKENEAFIESIEELQDKKVAVVYEYASADIIKKENIQVVEVNSIKEGLIKVRKGEVFGLVDNVHTIGNVIKENAFYDLKIDGNLNKELKWSMATNKENITLLNILNKTLFSIDKQIIKDIYKKHTLIKSYVEVVDYWLIAKISFLAFIIVLVLLYRNVTLKNYSKKIISINRELEVVSTTDGLTNMYNRRKIEAILDEQIKIAKRDKNNLSIIMLDIDNFKSINDKYGHEYGDRTLISFSKILKDNIRPTDSVGRWGGEEFLIVCSHSDEKIASVLADRLKEIIQNHKFETIGTCTASFGVAQFEEIYTKSNLISYADAAMYKAKKEGRNNVIVHKIDLT